MAKEPNEKDIQDAVNCAGRLAACLRDAGHGAPTLLDVLSAATVANVGLARNDRLAAAAKAWIDRLDDIEPQS